MKICTFSNRLGISGLHEKEIKEKFNQLNHTTKERELKTKLGKSSTARNLCNMDIKNWN
jgi:hypothetical protein